MFKVEVRDSDRNDDDLVDLFFEAIATFKVDTAWTQFTALGTRNHGGECENRSV